MRRSRRGAPSAGRRPEAARLAEPRPYPSTASARASRSRSRRAACPSGGRPPFGLGEPERRRDPTIAARTSLPSSSTGKEEGELIGRLSDRDHPVERPREPSMRPHGERLPLEGDKGFRGNRSACSPRRRGALPSYLVPTAYHARAGSFGKGGEFAPIAGQTRGPKCLRALPLRPGSTRVLERARTDRRRYNPEIRGPARAYRLRAEGLPKVVEVLVGRPKRRSPPPRRPRGRSDARVRPSSPARRSHRGALVARPDARSGSSAAAGVPERPKERHLAGVVPDAAAATTPPGRGPAASRPPRPRDRA